MPSAAPTAERPKYVGGPSAALDPHCCRRLAPPPSPGAQAFRASAVRFATCGRGRGPWLTQAICLLPFACAMMARKKAGTRSKADIEQHRHELYERTCWEVDQLVAEHHARLPRNRSTSVGGIYARYSTRFQDSIADQVRSLLEEAEQRGIFVPREYVFFDLATRGYKDRRQGLNELRTALAEGKLAVLLVFATNRLYRKAYKSLQFVEEEVVERGGRCIFVNSGIDTADGDRWRAWMQFHAMMDETGAGMYADHVRAGHQGLFARGLV